MKKVALHVDYFADAMEALNYIIEDAEAAKASLEKIQQGTPLASYLDKWITALDMVYTRLSLMLEEVDEEALSTPQPFAKEDLN